MIQTSTKGVTRLNNDYNDLEAIKKRILREDAVEKIFEAMDCEFITISGGRVEAQLPSRFNSNNKRSTQCRLNSNLSCAIRTKPDFEGGDIFSLVSYIVNDKRGDEIQADLYNAKVFICETLGWREYLNVKNRKAKNDYLAPMRNILKAKKRRVEIKSNPVIPEEVLDEYLPYPCQKWMKEGISFKTQKMYGIGFCLESRRITIPMRNRFGQLVGVKGRIFNDNDDDRKYLYLHPYNNRYEWFNFHYAHPYILMEKKVYIFEGEKSCMKAFDLGIYNTLAIGASEISTEQAHIIKQLGLDIEIVLCYDKGMKIEEIKANCDRFGSREVHVMYDTDEVLSGKNSPIDEGIDKWNELLDNYVFSMG